MIHGSAARLGLALPTAAPPRTLRAGERPSTVANGFEFAIVGNLTDFDALENDWRALFADAARPNQVFQDFAWLRLWARFYLDRSTTLSIVSARLQGRLVLVWPLVTRRRFGLRVLMPMGDPTAQYTDALVATDLDASLMDQALAYVGDLPVDVVALRRVREDSALSAALGDRYGPPANQQRAPYVDFTGIPDVASFEARFPSKLRSARRRRWRRLAEQGVISVARFGPSSEARALVIKAFAFKRQWAQRHGIVSPTLRDERFAAFFIAAATPGSAIEGLRVCALSCGGELVGVEVSIACKGHLFGHVLAPNPAFERFGAGGLLAEATLHGAIGDGLACTDLLAPADSYKCEWTALSVGVGDFVVPRTLPGRLFAIWLNHGRPAAKSFVAAVGAKTAHMRRFAGGGRREPAKT